MFDAPVQNAAETRSPHPGPEHVQHVFQLASGVLVAAAMHATLTARIPDLLAHGPRNVSYLARESGMHEQSLYRCLRAMATVGLFSEVSPRVFENTLCSEVLRSSHPVKAIDTALWMTNPFHFRTYGEFLHSVRTGRPCVEQVYGVPVFEYFPTDAECNREFNSAMTSLTAMAVPALLASYDFGGLGTLCDVAGGHGRLMTSILKKHRDLQGIIFDLGHVIEETKEQVRDASLEHRCHCLSGDFFKAVPAADSYVMKHIIHDWEEEKAITILRNCVNAMRGNGKIILVEAVLPEGDTPHLAKFIDLEMLAMPGGQERSAREYHELLNKAGLRITRIVPNDSPLWAIEAVKA